MHKTGKVGHDDPLFWVSCTIRRFSDVGQAYATPKPACFLVSAYRPVLYIYLNKYIYI